MRNLFIFVLFIGLSSHLSAQRFGYVDTDFILENLPQYTQAQQRLKTQTEQWNQEVQNRQAAVDKRHADFLNEKVLLTQEQIQKEQEDIDFEIKSIKELQEKRYGQGGDLIKLRQSLVKPIQDQVWNAVKSVAEKRNYGFIFDKGSDLIMVYTDPKFDISREVLLQLNPNAVVKEEPKSGSGNTGGKGNTNSSSGKGKNSSGSKGNSSSKGNNSRSSNSGGSIKK
ncbi:OmpH family outer membrane protein [Moheibacter sediminis]|uniref:Periplasmic chaperone for outer membrane proteins Skp n=1 Tax=Moheibacter sediminis TaxID=1434700 RepID=A0A1W1YAY0_9FLAO|nr:OmpH family outer membrane protein [Moheibacter sediminis]SMC33317.1 periplasmic chaperone for outer membrane proteins Skp [Moheibacter sediminis]